MLSAVSVATTLAFDVGRTLAIDHKVTVQPVGSYREALWCIASVDQACSLAHHSLIDQLDTPDIKLLRPWTSPGQESGRRRALPAARI